MLHRLQADGLLVDPLVEIPVLIQHIGDAAGHAGCKVFAGLAQHHHGAAGHVLTAVVAHALHNGGSTRVADAEALAGHTGDEHLTGGGTVEGHVAGDDVLLGLVGHVFRRADNDLAAGKAFAHVVVAVAGQPQGQALGNERAKALAAGSVAADGVHIVRQVSCRICG